MASCISTNLQMGGLIKSKQWVGKCIPGVWFSSYLHFSERKVITGSSTTSGGSSGTTSEFFPLFEDKPVPS
jgi:hypothetical protein